MRWWLLLLGTLVFGCGQQDVDLEDELKGKEDYEVVLLSQPKPPERKAAPVDTAVHASAKPDSLAAAPIEAEKTAPAEMPIVYDPGGGFTIQIGSDD